MMQAIPITILAGSDHKPGHLPESGAELHPLASYKGAEVTVGGRPLIEIIIENIREADTFESVTIAGPEKIYRPLGLQAEIIDTNGSVADNLRAAINHHIDQFGSDKPLALLTYDVVPSTGEFLDLVAHYRNYPPCAIWMPFVRMPQDKDALGPFAWKPSYSLQFEGEEEPTPILPGHFAIAFPAALRLDLLYKLLDLAYTTRNHSVSTRLRVMTFSILTYLLREDAWALAGMRAPRMTVSVLKNGFGLARKLLSRRLTIPDLERYLNGMFLREDTAFYGNPCKGIRHPGVDILSLAEDVDTEEEAKGLEKTHPSVKSQPSSDKK